ncbi:hypothetical protein AGDE_03597 [Angomonas deanei]|uniref:MYND-type domain-containing protein n=1 Tax=Angomonas deanei TaxID=59799 RepID=A0A7G2C8Z6_9TRYP|nr:hypothetical protein AGDE_03597 [Angomonas deanei]CAD2215999.1 hypothetical protein, conserved [Angomonas deanei]|eukprot:EPY40331.1 hypothetical protein AGDE_03597 [Angomonas deanei]
MVFPSSRSASPVPRYRRRRMAYSRGEESATHIDLDVHFDTLEAGVLGLHNKVAPTSPSAKPREEPLKDVRLRCAGSRTCGWFMGAVVASVGGIPLELPQPVRFLLKRYTGRRCTHCLDPVYSIGFTCHYCEVPRYCCRECMVAHQRHGHALVCAHLKLAYGQRAGVVANEINQDIRLVAWWTSLGGSRYSVLADANAAMDIAIEYFLDTLDEGDLTYRVIYTKETSEAKLRGMPEEAVMGYSTMLLKEVFYSAVRDGFHGLASACLYQLFRHCASNPITLEVHDDFYTIFNYEDFEGPVNTVEEYVSHTRPLHCLALLHMERALRSTISNDFWKSIRDAKEVLVALFSVYMSDPCKELEEIQPVIDLQRVETLFLLSKALLIMAARTPREDCIATLETAEKCLSQALLINCVQQDDRLHAACLFRLSILQRLYNEPERILEAEDLKQKGMMLLRSSGSVTQPAERRGDGRG